MLESILFFLVLCYSLGLLIDLFIKNWSCGIIEKSVLRLGAGILLVPLLGVILDLVGIPLHWTVFLLIALILGGTSAYLRRDTLLAEITAVKRSFSSFKFLINMSVVYQVGVLILFVLSAYMYIGGSFAYPWLEDGDPYGYALTSKYIAEEKTFQAPYYFMHFAYPYTQGYQILMGVLMQTNDSTSWTLKFFNALIISFSILLFYYFVKQFTKSNAAAFWSSLILAGIPAWLSHFAFSLNFNMSLMFLPLYAFFSINENKNWKYAGALFFGSLLISHFYTAFIIAVFIGLAYAIRVTCTKEFNRDYLDLFLLGALVSLIFWIPAFVRNWNLIEKVSELNNGSQLGGLDMFYPLLKTIFENYVLQLALLLVLGALVLAYLKYDLWFKYVKKLLEKRNAAQIFYLFAAILVFLILVVPSDKLIYAKGSGTREYTMKDFFVAEKGNLINNPIGIGWAAMFIFLAGLLLLIVNFWKLFQEQQHHLLVALTWLIFSFIGVMGASLSIGFVPFRMWTFFGMVAAIISGYILCQLGGNLNKVFSSASLKIVVKILLFILLLTGLYFTSFQQKYWHNTATWPEHQVLVPESEQFYVWLKVGGLPKNTRVINICNRPSMLVGYDMFAPSWESEEMDEKDNINSSYYLHSLNETWLDNYRFLKENKFSYVTLGASCVAKFKYTPEQLNTRLQEFFNSTKFSLVYNTKTEFLFKVS